MYTLNKPANTIAEVLAACLDATIDVDLHSRLTAIRVQLEGGAAIYEANAMAAALHQVARVTGVGSVTKLELMSLYTDHMSAAKGSSRSVYDAIKGAAPNKLCPLCSVGSVAHLDHHLPQSKYPDLALLPLNLVPACHFCNDTKKARFPKTVGEQSFHPYYDSHLLSAQWIRATLDPGPPPLVVFSVVPPATWTLDDSQRVQRHFIVCGLSIPYATHANSVMTTLRARLVSLHQRGGVVAVQAYLEEERDAYAAKVNSWQHVFFQTLAADTWFVNGGFTTIE